MSQVIQIIDNAAVPTVFLVLVTTALAGQVLSLRVISLSLVSAIIGGAYVARAVLTIFHTDALWLALFAGACGGSLVAYLGALLDVAFGEKSRMLALLGSLGFLKLLQGLITLLTGGGIETFIVNINQHFDPNLVFCSPIWLPYGLILALVAASAHWYFLQFTRIGSAAIAVGDDPLLASLFGVPVVKVQTLIQSAGGAIAGISGVVMALDSGLRPDIGFNVALKAFGILIISNSRHALLFPALIGLVGLEQIIGYRWGGQLREASGLVLLSVIIVLAHQLGWYRRPQPINAVRINRV